MKTAVRLASWFGLAIAAFYIYTLWKIFEKAGKPGWAAIIPIYNLIVLLEIVGRPIWWVVLFLIPVVSFIISIIVAMDLSKSFGHGALYGLGLAFLGFIFGPILAFRRRHLSRPIGASASLTVLPRSHVSMLERQPRCDIHRGTDISGGGQSSLGCERRSNEALAGVAHDYELLFIDDDSQDGSEEICEELSKRLPGTHRGPKRRAGPCHRRNPRHLGLVWRYRRRDGRRPFPSSERHPEHDRTTAERRKRFRARLTLRRRRLDRRRAESVPKAELGHSLTARAAALPAQGSNERVLCISTGRHARPESPFPNRLQDRARDLRQRRVPTIRASCRFTSRSGNTAKASSRSRSS